MQIIRIEQLSSNIRYGSVLVFNDSKQNSVQATANRDTVVNLLPSLDNSIKES